MNVLSSAITDEELLDIADLSEQEYDELEHRLAITAACLGWSGDPIRQPLETVAAIVRIIVSERSE
jgi:hypothetical protein